MKPIRAALIFIAILFVGIIVSQVTGLWESESDKIPILTESGEYDPGDIRGSYTFGDVENAFSVPAELLAKIYAIETDSPDDFPIKDLEEIYIGLAEVYPEYEEVEIGTGSIRFFVSLYTGIESELAVPEYIPLMGLNYLLENQLITQEEFDLYEDLAINLNNYSQIYDPESTEEIEEEDHVEPIVKGGTLVQEVLDAGITLQELEEIMGITIDNRAALIKDLCTENGLIFSEIKDEINVKLIEEQ